MTDKRPNRESRRKQITVTLKDYAVVLTLYKAPDEPVDGQQGDKPKPTITRCAFQCLAPDEMSAIGRVCTKLWADAHKQGAICMVINAEVSPWTLFLKQPEQVQPEETTQEAPPASVVDFPQDRV